MSFTQIKTVTYVTHTCKSCGIYFALESTFDNENLSQKGSGVGWNCPNPNCNSGIWHYTGESDAQKISRIEYEKRLEQEKRERAERDMKVFRDEAYKANEKSKRLRATVKKKYHRIKNGVCLHCDRSFQNLQRHMVTKHSGQSSTKGFKVKKIKLP